MDHTQWVLLDRVPMTFLMRCRHRGYSASDVQRACSAAGSLRGSRGFQSQLNMVTQKAMDRGYGRDRGRPRREEASASWGGCRETSSASRLMRGVIRRVRWCDHTSVRTGYVRTSHVRVRARHAQRLSHEGEWRLRRCATKLPLSLSEVCRPRTASRRSDALRSRA